MHVAWMTESGFFVIKRLDFLINTSSKIHIHFIIYSLLALFWSQHEFFLSFFVVVLNWEYGMVLTQRDYYMEHQRINIYFSFSGTWSIHSRECCKAISTCIRFFCCYVSTSKNRPTYLEEDGIIRLTWKWRGLTSLSMTSVRQNAKASRTMSFPYMELSVTQIQGLDIINHQTWN
jgi:hypothetical protein